MRPPFALERFSSGPVGQGLFCAATVSRASFWMKGGGGCRRKLIDPQTISPCTRKCGGKGGAGNQLDGISRGNQPRSGDAPQGE